MFQYVLKGIGHVVLERGECGKGKSYIVKDVMFAFCEAFSRDPSIHPSISLVIHPWMASYKEENPSENKYPPPLCACVAV